MIILIINIIICLVLYQCISATPSWRRFYDVDNLIAEPDYRAVKLKWNYYNEHGLTGFKVKFCEISAWNSKIRCRERHLPLLSPQTSRKMSREDSLHDILSDKLIRSNRGTFEASIYDLRMLTNYTFNVRADFDSNIGYGLSSYPIYSKNPADSFRPHTSFTDFDDYQRNVVVETKSFSAQTSRCLANTSDVIVNTGPYFSGKIAVEDAFDNRCSVYGNRSSTQNVYTLTILHDVCGSKIINNSRIETMVMVHENREILTHNSRRFLVVCNFVPETFTLTASVAVPTHLLKRKYKTDDNQSHSIDSNVISSKPNTNTNSESETDTNERSNDIFTYDHYKQHNVRDSRMLANQEHRILHNNNDKNMTDQHWNQLFSTILFVISGLIFCVIALLWFTTTPQISDKNKELKTYISMSSPSIDKKLNQNNAILRVNGSPIALVSIDPLGESFA
jgi:hypothetical protein